MKSCALEIRCIGTNEVVRTLDVSGKTQGKVERVTCGLLVQLHRDAFSIADSADEIGDQRENRRAKSARSVGGVKAKNSLDAAFPRKRRGVLER